MCLNKVDSLRDESRLIGKAVIERRMSAPGAAQGYRVKFLTTGYSFVFARVVRGKAARSRSGGAAWGGDAYFFAA